MLSPLVSAVYIFGGLAAIVWGGNLVVDSAKAIALSFGLSQTLVGLTVVALGTSLPELVTSVVASRKGENGLALGNVIGSNIFNILMVLATSAAVHPIAVTGFDRYSLSDCGQCYYLGIMPQQASDQPGRGTGDACHVCGISGLYLCEIGLENRIKKLRKKQVPENSACFCLL